MVDRSVDVLGPLRYGHSNTAGPTLPVQHGRSTKWRRTGVDRRYGRDVLAMEPVVLRGMRARSLLSPPLDLVEGLAGRLESRLDLQGLLEHLYGHLPPSLLRGEQT